LLDVAGEALLGQLMPSPDVRDGAVADRPDMLDRVHPRLRRTDGIPAVAGHRQAKLVRLLDRSCDQIERQTFVDLDDMLAELRPGPGRGARLGGVGAHDVAAARAVAGRVGRGPSAADGAPGREHARAADLAELRSPPLPDRPRPVLEDLDGDTGRNPEVQ